MSKFSEMELLKLSKQLELKWHDEEVFELMKQFGLKTKADYASLLKAMGYPVPSNLKKERIIKRIAYATVGIKRRDWAINNTDISNGYY